MTWIATEDQQTIAKLTERCNHLHKTLKNIEAAGDNHATPAQRLYRILNIVEGSLEKDREEFLQPIPQQVAQALTQDG